MPRISGPLVVFFVIPCAIDMPGAIPPTCPNLPEMIRPEYISFVRVLHILHSDRSALALVH